MKKLLLTLLMAIVLTGCNPGRQSDTETIPRPVPIQLGMVECYECCGDGLIDIEKESVHCPRCNGLGRLNKVEMGVLKNYSTYFIHGYQAHKDGESFKKAPILKIRSKEWKKGWLAAEEEAKK